MSIPCGLPGWTRFLELELDRVGLTGDGTRLLAAGQYEEAAGLVAEALGTSQFDALLLSRYGMEASIQLRGPVLRLPELALGPVITTNFDGVLEQVFARAGSAFHKIASGADASLLHDAIFDDERVLLKLHGDAGDPEHRVLTYQEYEGHYGDDGEREQYPVRPLPKLLEKLFTTRCLLFIGCSLVSDRSLRLLRQVKRLHAAPPQHYAIVEAPVDAQTLERRCDELETLNIRALWYPNGEHANIAELLAAILEPEVLLPQLAEASAHHVSTSTQEADPILCVDFGTSNCLAALWHPEKGYVPLSLRDGIGVAVPTCVTFANHLQCSVGALPGAVGQICFRHFKRAIGTEERYQVGPASFTAESLTVLVLRHIRMQAEQLLGRPVTNVLSAAPANFSTRQRNLLASCFTRAGFKLGRLIAEPCAAALNLYSSGTSTVLVVDLGGGTMDVSLVEVGDNLVQVYAVAGDNRLGGVDFDAVIEEFLRQQLILRFGTVGRTLFERYAPWFALEAERVKVQIASGRSADIVIPGLDTGAGTFEVFRCELGPAEFRARADGLVKQVEACIDKVLDPGARYWKSIEAPSAVMLAGQGGLVGPIVELLRGKVPDAELILNFQENAVVRGLAIEAGILQGRLRDVLLLDTSYRGLGIRCTEIIADGPFGVIRIGARNERTAAVIARNRSIPTMAKYQIVIGDCGEAPVLLQLVEFSASSGGAPEALGDLVLEGVGPGSELELLADVDASATRSVRVRLLPNGEWSANLSLDWHLLGKGALWKGMWKADKDALMLSDAVHISFRERGVPTLEVRSSPNG
jgi:molecular chaperone DnaK (HSP70)